MGLKDYRLAVEGEDLRGLGAIEGNVDKLIASRMKKRGMSWTKRGANRMARLINLRDRGQLHLWANRRDKRDGSHSVPVSPKARSENHKSSQGEYRAWIEARLRPALYGPHANRPWAQTLSAIAHATGAITGIRPTKS